jgi:drug/metabolite transporter (DMT)-like permease
MSALAKLVGARLPVQEIIFFRGIVLAGLTYAMIRRRGLDPWGREKGLLVFRGLLGYGALSCFFFAVLHLPLADTTTIHFTNPVFGAILAVFVLGEVMRGWEVVLVLLSLGGVLLVAQPDFLFGSGAGHPPLAVGVALLGAFFSAAAYVTVRRLTRTNDPLVIVFYFGLTTVVGSLPFTLATYRSPSPRDWFVLAGVGLATLAGQVFVTRGLQMEKAARVMAVGYLQIVFAGLLGMVFFAEAPNAWSLMGTLVIIGSTFLMGRTHPVAAPSGR